VSITTVRIRPVLPTKMSQRSKMSTSATSGGKN